MKNAARFTNSSAGFTLIETMVTLTILAILVAIAAPAMNDFMNTNRLTAHNGALRQALQYARNEAVSKNLPVSICASSNQTSCTGDGTWAQGWIVFSDTDGSGAVNGTDAVLRTWDGLSDNFTLAGTTATFSSTGELTSADPALQLTAPADSNGDVHSRSLSVNGAGWVTVSKAVASSGSGGSGGSGGGATGGTP